MRYRVKSGFVLGPGKHAEPGQVITLDEIKDVVLLSAVRDFIEPIPDVPAAGTQPQNRDPQPRNRTPRPRTRTR